MTTISSKLGFSCSICSTNRTYKRQSGLQRHETLKHSQYNTPPAHILPVPDYELAHIKKVMVRDLQKRLKKHHSTVGEQAFSLHCSENAFIGIFGQYLERYSPCGNFYQCCFKGETSCDILAKIFNDNQWYERDYGQGQLSWVKLIPETNDQCVNNINGELSQNNQNNRCDGFREVNEKKRKKKRLRTELFVKWSMKGFTDMVGHGCHAGNVTFRFIVDNAMFG